MQQHVACSLSVKSKEAVYLVYWFMIQVYFCCPTPVGHPNYRWLSAAPTFTKFLIHDNRQCGVVMTMKVSGTLCEDCELFGNGKVGIEISHHSAPELLRCSISYNNMTGVNAHDEAGGALKDCELHNNGHHGLVVH